ncbi:Adaptor complexes medium subunit family protein [Histomonas meleagridis]|uniref:Adaptor complexes medium subunit family protein n=1 Tax=Histomonas meleagridis TaxID=135588 RepID=UPI00355AAC85|nr:Adaptor complexes medium subunit family protein [Histomonas meleagridis]KAH0804203.1 Adaptor complexes medium subunit family protein [Histomonas meleagridis]
MIKSIFIISKNGEVLIEKHYQDKTKREELEPVCYSIKNSQNPPPIIESFGILYLIVKENNLFIVGACDADAPTLFTSVILSSIAPILQNTMKNGFTEASVKTEYPVVYQTLDQILNCGYPFLDEQNVLISTMKSQNSDKINVDNQHPWRTSQTVKGPGEIYVEATETIETRINSHGKSDLLMVRGSISIHSHLNGSPQVNLSIAISNVLDDYTFHRCIGSSQYLGRKFQFVPPDGDFVLMTYTTKPQIANLPVFLVPKFTWSKVGVIFEINIRIDQNLPKPLEDVKVTFSFPDGISCPSLATAAGSVSYDVATKTVKWDVNISKKEFLILSGSASISTDFEPEACEIPIFVSFTAPGFTMSGLKVEAVDVENMPKVTKAIKYTTKAGNYVFSGCA